MGTTYLPNLGVAQQFAEQADEDHGAGGFAAFGSLVELFEDFVLRRGKRGGADFAGGHIAAELLATLLEIFHFGAVVAGTVERRFGEILVGDGNAEARAEDLQLFFVQLFLLVGDVLAFAAFAETVAFDRLGENDGWRALVLDGFLVGSVDLDGIVSTEAQVFELFVGEMLDHFEQARIGAEEVLAEVAAGFDSVLLELAVGDFAHPLDEQTVGVFGDELVPVAAPDDLDDVPSGAAEVGFELLDDLEVAANRAIETLQVAVDDEDQVVEAFARGERDGAEGFGLVGFAVAEESPDFAASRGF